MKKTIIKLGAFTVLIVPVATVVACGNNGNTNTTKLKQDSALSAKADIGDYTYPTLGEMFEDPMGLALLFDAKIVDESAYIEQATKDKLKQEIRTDEKASKLDAINVDKFNTKVKWDAYVDTKLKMGELYSILQRNDIGNLKIEDVDKSSNNSLLITPDSSKEEIKKSIKTIWQDNQDLMTKYLNYVDANKTAKDVYYGLAFMRATSNIENIMSALISVDASIYSTDQEKLDFFQKTVLGGSMDIMVIANGIKDKFSGKVPGFNEAIVLVAGKIENNIFTKGPASLWDIAIKAMGGEDVIEYLINKVGISFA